MIPWQVFAGFGVLWIGSGICAWGLALGWLTHHQPSQSHTRLAGLLAVLGLIGLGITLCEGIPRHWRWVPLNKEERFAAWREIWPKCQWEDFR